MDGYAEWRALESVEMYEEKWRDDVGDNGKVKYGERRREKKNLNIFFSPNILDPKINIHVQQTEEEFTAMLHLILARSSATSSSSSSS